MADRHGPRTFDPVRLGRRECDVWVAYYRHEWGSLLASYIDMVRMGYGVGAIRTLRGAWYALRANQAWSPYPDNDPEAARAYMRRFYALIGNEDGLSLDPTEAAQREVEWWRVHRIHQHEDGVTEDDLRQALVDLYSYVYGLEPEAVAEAARLRVIAMGISDEWVAAGCDPTAPALAEERRTLVASYTALRDSLDRQGRHG